MVNLTCPSDSVPDALPIPQNISYAVVPSQTAPDDWMKRCCGQNPVHVVQYCWEWCELSANLTKQGVSQAQFQFNTCLNTNGREFNHSSAVEMHMSKAPTEHPGYKIALVAILITWLCTA